MIDILQCFFAGFGMVAVFFAISYGIITGLSAFSEASARKQKETERFLKLLEKIEANTAKTESTPSTDRA